MKLVSVLLVDDYPLFLSLITRFLQEQCADEIGIIGVAFSGYEALNQAQALNPEVVLLDLSLPDLSGLDVIPRLRVILPATVIIVLTWHKAEGYRQAALAAGADGFVSKATLATDLLPTIRSLIQTSQFGSRN